MRSRAATTYLALIVSACVVAATPTFSATLQDLQVIGSGTGESNCLATLTPNCTIRTEGTATAAANGALLFDGTFAIRFDTGTVGTPNGWPAGAREGTQQGICAPAAYLGWLTTANGDTLTFNHVGTVCEEAAPGSPFHYNGTFRISGGTGQFAAASGTGNVVVTWIRTMTEGLLTLMKMSGTISY